MSKSLGNYIGVTDLPLICLEKFYQFQMNLCGDTLNFFQVKSLKEIEEIKKGVENGTMHPKK